MKLCGVIFVCKSLNLNKILLFIILLLSIRLNAQTNVDSLKKAISKVSITEKCKLLYNISNYYKNNENYDSVIKYAEIGLIFADRKDKDKYKFYELLSNAYENQANSPKVIYYYNLMINEAERKKDLKSMSELYLKTGMKYGRLYLFDKALYYFQNSLETYKLLNDSIGISNSYKNLGLLYLATNEPKIAIENLQHSLNISLNINDKKSTAYALKGFGSVYSISLNNFKTGLKYQLKALVLLEEINDKKGIINTLSDIAESYRKLKMYKNAIEYYQRSIAKCNNNKDQMITALLFHRIGKTYFEINDFNNAYKYLKQAEKISDNIGDIAISCINYNVLSEWYSKNNDYKKAFEYHKLFTIANDSIKANQNNDRINQLKIKYDIAGIEKETQILKQKSEIQQFTIQKQTILRNTFIAISILITIIVLFVFYRFLLKKKANRILFEKNRQINYQKNQLEEAYATKDKLFAIITHDLKNPFGTIISLAGFLEESYTEIDENHKIHAIKTLRKSADSAYNLLENLTKWLMSQNKNIPINNSLFDINISIQTIISFYKIETEKKNIKIVSDIVDETYVFADEQMIKTIIRNLLSNAIKFTLENGKIFIKIINLQNEIHVSIKDNGIGIKKEDKEKIFKIESNFTTTGTSKEKGSGLGLILSKEFAERNNSKIWFESEEGKGSTFYFSIMKKTSKDE